MLKYLTLALLLFTINSYSQNIYSALHLNDERYYKAVHPQKITETNFNYTSNGKEIETQIQTFDIAGMIIKEEDFDESEKLIKRLTFINDTTKHSIIEIILERWNSFGNTTQFDYYSYDTSNFLVGIENKNIHGTIFSSWKIINNEVGNPIEISGFDANGNSYGQETATYLYDMNRVVTHVISNNGQIISTDTLKIKFKKNEHDDKEDIYNDKGDITRYLSKNLNGTKTSFQINYTYDTAGNCINEEKYIVTMKSNGKQKLKLKSTSQKEYLY